MKFKALIASLLVSTSSVALADDYSFKGKFDGDISVRDHRDGEWRRRPQWMPISQMVTASRRTVIRVDEHNDELRAIRLHNGTGATYVYSITLRYEDGHRENIDVGKWLYSGDPMLTFDLAQNHELDRIVINTWTSMRSTFRVMGQKVRRFERPPIMEPLPTPPPMPPINTLPAYGLSIGKDLTFAGTAGYVHLPVGSEKGNFHKVRLEGMGAGSFIGRVYVTFPTGLHQSFEVNKVLYRGETIDFDLTGKGTQQITAITVMAGNADVRAQGQGASRFGVTLL
ncbi:MAG: hypothetical protein M4D80_18600 [Myxococcota bacterium]|nr:hypothetical protein [Deltaproteobacteria bacterium]MDQ3337177.1 hypothetical protein [Myxococcota bacterium]